MKCSLTEKQKIRETLARPSPFTPEFQKLVHILVGRQSLPATSTVADEKYKMNPIEKQSIASLSLETYQFKDKKIFEKINDLSNDIETDNSISIIDFSEIPSYHQLLEKVIFKAINPGHAVLSQFEGISKKIDEKIYPLIFENFDSLKLSNFGLGLYFEERKKIVNRVGCRLASMIDIQLKDTNPNIKALVQNMYMSFYVATKKCLVKYAYIYHLNTPLPQNISDITLKENYKLTNQDTPEWNIYIEELKTDIDVLKTAFGIPLDK